MRLGFAARYVPSSVKVYPDDQDSRVRRQGDPRQVRRGARAGKAASGPDNKIATHTLTGKPFAHYDT